MSKYRINYKAREGEWAGEWIDSGLDVEAMSEEEAIAEALRQKRQQETGATFPSDPLQLMAALYVMGDESDSSESNTRSQAASLLGAAGKGKRKVISAEERERRRARMVEMNRARATRKPSERTK